MTSLSSRGQSARAITDVNTGMSRKWALRTVYRLRNGPQAPPDRAITNPPGPARHAACVSRMRVELVATAQFGGCPVLI